MGGKLASWLGIAVVLLGAGSAGAVDLTGSWRFVLVGDFGDKTVCSWNVVQTGTSLSFSGGVGPCPPSLSGTINGTTFSISGAGGSCPVALTMQGDASADGDNASGNWSCGGFGTTFTGGRVFCDPQNPGTVCDDGNPCTQDVCDPDGMFCTHVPPACNDQNVCTDDGYEAGTCACTHTNNTAPCNDLKLCTVGDTCSGGVCVSGMTTCNPCESCTSLYGCVVAPRDDCRRPTASLKSLVSLKDNATDARDAVSWRWSSGANTDVNDFGNPVATTAYTLCLFDESAAPQPLLRADVPPDGSCGGRPCWKHTSTGFRYHDASLAAGGLRLIKLKAGAPGKSAILVGGKGANLGMPGLPLTPAATVQLENRENGKCWSAAHDLVLVGRTDAFKAKGD